MRGWFAALLTLADDFGRGGADFAANFAASLAAVADHGLHFRPARYR